MDLVFVFKKTNLDLQLWRHGDFVVILLKFLKFLRDSRMLATILTLLCHGQDSVAIHKNCINPILDLISEKFFFSSCNKYLECSTVLCITV